MEGLGDVRVVVLMGGQSKEREVSIATGKAVIEACQSLGAKDVVAFDPAADPLEYLIKLKPFVAFNALHGRFGEDGCMQGLLEVLNVPYTGPRLLACALSMNKWLTKKVLLANGLPVPRAVHLATGREEGLRGVLQEAALEFPLVVKPNEEGSSLGVTIANASSELQGGLDLAKAYGGGVLIEEYIEGAEVQVAVLEGRVLGSIEILPEGGFYDYRAKYTPGASRHLIPPRIEPEPLQEAERIALKTHEALCLEPLSRIDLRVHPRKGAYVLEANALPGMTPTSLVPEIARYAGISFVRLVWMLVQNAVNRPNDGRFIVAHGSDAA